MTCKNYRYLIAVLSMTALLALAMCPPFFPDWLKFASVIFFSKACHQIAERSIYVGGAPMAVCARCFGIYSGAWIGILLAPPLTRKLRQSKVLFGLFIPILLDVAINIVTDTPAFIRAMTGILAGFAGAVIALPAFIEETPWRRIRQVRRNP